MNKRVNILLQVFVCVTFLIALATGTSAQTIDQISYYQDPATEGKWTVEGQFDKPVTQLHLKTHILKLETAEKQPRWKDSDGVEAPLTFFPDLAKVNSVFVYVPELAPGMYILIVVTEEKDEDGKITTVPMTKSFKVLSKDEQAAPTTGPAPMVPQPVQEVAPPTRKLAEAKGKADAEFYFAGEILTANGAKPHYTVDVKIEPEISGIAPDWKRRADWKIYPAYFYAKYSTNPSADPDSFTFGSRAEWRNTFEKTSFVYDKLEIDAIAINFGGKMESTKNFKNTNVVGETKLTFNFNTWHPIKDKPGTSFYFNPYVGVEAGSNIQHEVAKAANQGLFRPVAGINALFYTRLPNAAPERNFAWETNYVIRWPLMSEVEYNGDGVLTNFGRRPKDHFETKLIFNLSPYLSPYIGFEWGRLPPNYKLVDQVTKIGFVYKFSFSK